MAFIIGNPVLRRTCFPSFRRGTPRIMTDAVAGRDIFGGIQCLEWAASP